MRRAIGLSPWAFLSSQSEKPGKLEVFDLRNQTLQWSADFDSKIWAVEFSVNGQQLAVGGEGPELQVFNTERKEPAVRFPFQWQSDCREEREPCKINGCVDFSMDGKYVISWGSDKRVRVMDVTADREIQSVDLPGNPVAALLSGDDNFLAVSSGDLMGRAFDITSTQPREVWHRPMGQEDFFPFAFTSNDKYILMATASNEMVVHRLLWHSQDLIDRACAVLDRNLTTQEWSGFSRDKQSKACPTLP